MVGASPPTQDQEEPKVTVTAPVNKTVFVHEVPETPFATVTFAPE
jgi:hypothetical protein